MSENQQISVKLSGSVIVSKAFLSTMSSIIHFFNGVKVFVNITFYETENEKLQDDPSSKYLLFDLPLGQKSISQNYATIVL